MPSTLPLPPPLPLLPYILFLLPLSLPLTLPPKETGYYYCPRIVSNHLLLFPSIPSPSAPSPCTPATFNPSPRYPSPHHPITLHPITLLPITLHSATLRPIILPHHLALSLSFCFPSFATVKLGRFDGRNVSEGPQKNQCPSQICLIIIVI